MRHDNILIVNTFGIGDVLFSTPLISELKRAFPASNIYFLCNRRNYDLFKNDPDINRLLVYEKDELRALSRSSKIKFAGALFGLIRGIRRLNIDIAIDLTLNYQINTILILAGVKTRIGFNYKNRGKLLTHKIGLASFENKHVVEHYLELLKFVGIASPARWGLRAYTSADDKRCAEDFIRRNGLLGKTLVGIAAGGGKSWGPDAAYRRWGRENFAYVGRGLSELDDVRVLIFGTGEEQEICRHLQERIGTRAISLCGNTNLGLLVELIKRCGLFICNEGGPLHLAVSQDVRTLSIFGPVDDKVYGPYPLSDRHAVVKADGVECRPCYKKFKHAICEDRRCLKGIAKEKVLELAKKSLGL